MKKDFYVIVISYYKCVWLIPTITAITTVENDDNNKGMMETVEADDAIAVIDTCRSNWMWTETAMRRGVEHFDKNFILIQIFFFLQNSISFPWS